MRFISAKDFTGARAWDALHLALIQQATVRLHWTDKPYIWHVNDASEIFVVVTGTVDMHYKIDGDVLVHRLEPGDICVVEPGDEHVAHPQPVANILVVEEQGAL